MKKQTTNSSLTVEQAQYRLLHAVTTPQIKETVPLLAGLGRILAEDLLSLTDQPPFPRSPLDGYAVSDQDIRSASKETPVRLSVVQTIYAGDTPAQPLFSGQAARIMTGAPIPPGATCVVRQEDTNQGDDMVQIYQSHGPYENYCFQGEDTEKGRLLLRKGQKLTGAHLGLLASQGIPEVSVYPQPALAIFSTGSELVPPGTTLAGGKIYDSNSYLLTASALQLGAQVCPADAHKAGFPQSGSLPDDPLALASALRRQLGKRSLVITTGGVSVGTRDYLPQVAAKLDCDVLFQGIEAKPGSPVLALKKDGTVILCLSGNPFAAFATFQLLAAPVIRKLAGLANPDSHRVKGVMTHPFGKASPTRRFVRARIEAGAVFFPAENSQPDHSRQPDRQQPSGHQSGSLASLCGCNCLIDIPAGSPPLSAGAAVEVILF